MFAFSNDLKRVGNIPCGISGAEQIEVLKDHTVSPSPADKMSTGERVHTITAVVYGTGIGFLKQTYEPHKRRLSRTAFSDDAVYGIRRDGEAYVMHGVHRL
jgi:hypothetical protein